jgi:exosome complex exonuclease RRP6
MFLLPMRQGALKKNSIKFNFRPKYNPTSSYEYYDPIMDQTQDFKSLQDQIQAALLSTTRVSNQISSEDVGFQRSLNPQVGTALDEQTARLLELSSSLLKSAASISELHVPVLDDADDVDSNWRSIVDVVDSLLEKTDICLDEYTGAIKRKESPTVEQVGSFLRTAQQYGS